MSTFCGSGPMLVGHAHPEVTAAVHERITQGTTFLQITGGSNSPRRSSRPCPAPNRCVVSTGSEADLYAMRAARAFRKRDKILKFEGGFHGMSDIR